MFLEVKNIAFSYDGSRKVLDDISFTLPKGETIAIVGASGCGKSTLLRLISGILNTNDNQLSQGTININGVSADEYRKAGKLAFMFQEATLMPNLTVRQNIELPLRIKKVTNKQKVDDLLKTVGLSEFADYLPKQLSGGMKTRVALARSFVTEPELLLLDEPFSALDIGWKNKLYISLEKLKEKCNSSVVIVTHDVQEAVLLSDQIYVLGKSGTKLHYTRTLSVIPAIKRLDNIARFIKSDDFHKFYAPIQKWISDDVIRAVASRSEVEAILKKLSNFSDAEVETWDTLETDVLTLRNFSKEPNVHQVLSHIFQNSKNIWLKYELIWDVLNYKEIDEETTRSVFDFYISNIKYASTKAAEYYQRDTNEIFEHLVETRINSNKYPNTKKWIYVCDLFFSNETHKVLSYLNKIIEGNIEDLNYPFAKEVASKVKFKIENEKEAHISVA